MAGHQRGWDETKSPQWRYLLSTDAREKRQLQKIEEEQIKIKRVSKRQRLRKERTKAGKVIIYSASPTPLATGRKASISQELTQELKKSKANEF
jgi:hypothetical protein